MFSDKELYRISYKALKLLDKELKIKGTLTQKKFDLRDKLNVLIEILDLDFKQNGISKKDIWNYDN